MSEIVYNLGDSAVFCALHDLLASLDRHAQLTRCFSAVAELLVNGTNILFMLLCRWESIVIKVNASYSDRSYDRLP